jgi:1,4-dihydroxy-2-naphthoyl-CoA synthase
VGWWRLQRLKLLQLIDRLELAMVGSVFGYRVYGCVLVVLFCYLVIACSEAGTAAAADRQAGAGHGGFYSWLQGLFCVVVVLL